MDRESHSARAFEKAKAKHALLEDQVKSLEGPGAPSAQLKKLKVQRLKAKEEKVRFERLMQVSAQLQL